MAGQTVTRGRDPSAADGWAGADLDDFLRDRLGCARRALAARLSAVCGLGVFRDVWSTNGVIWCRISLDKQPGDLILDGLLTRLVGPLDDDLEASGIHEQAGVEFSLDGAGGRGAGEAGQADLLRDAGIEFQHGDGVPVGTNNIHLDRGIIYSASPNPFTDHIEINYGVFQKAKVAISVYDIRGQIVATLDERMLDPEKYFVSWNPHSNLPIGHYFISIKINDLQVHYLKIIRQ